MLESYARLTDLTGATYVTLNVAFRQAPDVFGEVSAKLCACSV